jgi:hypothetical protein
MKTLIWKIRYTYHVHRLLRVSILYGWDMAGSTVESFGEDIADGDLSPKEAAENERDEWLACADLTLLP